MVKIRIMKVFPRMAMKNRKKRRLLMHGLVVEMKILTLKDAIKSLLINLDGIIAHLLIKTFIDICKNIL